MLDIPDGLRYSVKVPNLPTLIQTGLKKRSESEAAYFLGQRALPPPNSFHFSQGRGLRLDLPGRTPRDPSPSRAPR
jgi:hypothetical protein